MERGRSGGMERVRRLFLWSNSAVKEDWMRAVAVEMGSRDRYKVKWVRLGIRFGALESEKSPW